MPINTDSTQLTSHLVLNTFNKTSDPHFNILITSTDPIRFDPTSINTTITIACSRIYLTYHIISYHIKLTIRPKTLNDFFFFSVIYLQHIIIFFFLVFLIFFFFCHAYVAYVYTPKRKSWHWHSTFTILGWMELGLLVVGWLVG